MEDIFGSLILLSFCIIISRWEYGQFNTILTPFGVMAWPYTIIVFMINFGGKYFGFFPVSLESILFVVLSLVFFLVGGHGILTLLRKIKSSKIPVRNNGGGIKEYLDLYRPLFVSLAIISTIAGVVHFFQSVHEVGGWLNIGSKDFSIAYGTGALAHIQNLSRPGFIFLFADYIYHRRKGILLLLGLILVMVLARQVKYHVFVLFLGGVYFSYMTNLIRVNPRKLLLISLGVYFLFNLSYVVGFSVLGLSYAYSSEVQSFLFNHFFTYLFGGPIAFSEVLRNNSYPLYSFQEIAAVPLNILKVLEGDPRLVDIIFHKWVDVSHIHTYFHSANIFGLFGMLWMYIGTYLTLVYLFFCGLLFYLLYFLANRGGIHIAFQMTIAFIMSFLTLSFFGFYFNKVNFVEVSLFTLALPPVYLAVRNRARFNVMKRRMALS